MSMTPDTKDRSSASQAAARSRIEFRSGDEAASLASRAVGFEPAGLCPAPPGNQVALCYGAALGGARVVGAATSQGLVAALEQLAVQSSARVPMVLNVALRAVAALPDGGCDHSALYQALNAGWIVLCARDPQAVYDFNLAAVRIGEHADVRLPVLVAYDGHVTSEQKRAIQVLDDPDALAGFLGTPPRARTPLDPAHPATFGAPLDEDDFLDNRAQLSLAMDAARRVIPEVFAELAQLTGRRYPMLEAYGMDDAEFAIVLLASAAEVAKEAVDVWRLDGRKAGLLSANVLRPFPAEEFRALLRHVNAATVADRADAYGAGGGNLSLEVRAALQQDADNATLVLSRIYGLGGAAFDSTDAERFLDAALAAATTGQAPEPFAYHASHVAAGAAAGAVARSPIPALPPIRPDELSRSMAKVRRDEATGRLDVELAALWKMTSVPGRIAPGHAACPGCGAFTTLHQLYKVLEGDVVVLFQSGCAIVASSSHAATAHRVNCIHNAAGNGAATLSGLVEAYHQALRRGELPASDEVTFVMVTGDGGMEADLGDAIAVAHRNPRMMILEYDNQGRMSTGGQATHSTTLGSRHSDTAQVLAACNLPYVFTASEGFTEDLMRKAAKAQWYARNEGMAYGKILSFCPLHWQAADDAAQPALQAAIDSCFFPLYEVEHGRTAITYDPDAIGRRKPVAEWLKLLGKTSHLSEPANAAIVEEIQAETERRWARLKALHEHPLL
jgi:pyruvate ferredoxin oxidoreductase alpha subunit